MNSDAFPVVFQHDSPEGAPVGEGEWILVADDDELALQTMRVLLQEHNFCVVTAHCGAHALKQYLAHRQKIALVIIEVFLADLDGVTVIQLLRLINPEVRVITMSGYAQIWPGVEALQADKEHFLGKPFTTRELLWMIRDTLRGPRRSREALAPSGFA